MTTKTYTPAVDDTVRIGTGQVSYRVLSVYPPLVKVRSIDAINRTMTKEVAIERLVPETPKELLSRVESYLADDKAAAERELDTPTLTAILCAETAATYRGQDETVAIPKADLLLILAAARR